MCVFVRERKRGGEREREREKERDRILCLCERGNKFDGVSRVFEKRGSVRE